MVKPNVSIKINDGRRGKRISKKILLEKIQKRCNILDLARDTIYRAQRREDVYVAIDR